MLQLPAFQHGIWKYMYAESVAVMTSKAIPLLTLHHKSRTVSIPESYQAIQGYIDPPKSELPCLIYIQLHT